jgi:hypothetical protein
VISALARSADPRRGAAGIFSGGLCAGLGCQIVSDGYALTAGTSMAAPGLEHLHPGSGAGTGHCAGKPRDAGADDDDATRRHAQPATLTVVVAG